MRTGAQKEPRVSGIGIFEKGWPSKKATLYVYVEGDPSLSPDLQAEASREASRQWQQSRLSTTGALQEAVAAGIRVIVRGGGTGASSAGVTCAVLQEESVYLAQAGATRAYVLGPLVCRRIAPSSPWDPNHADVREEPLPQASVLLLAPSMLEEALPLLQGGLPPREVHRLIKAWLQDKPQLSALIVGKQDGHELALGVGAGAANEEEKQSVPQPVARNRQPAARSSAALPPESEKQHPTGEAPFPVLRAMRLPLLMIAALLALLVLGGVAWYIPSRQKGEDEARLVQLLDRAESTRQQASINSNASQARGLLTQADGLAKDAAGISPKDKRVFALQQEITTDLDRINAVIRPGAVVTLADLGKDGGSQSNPSRIIVDGNNIYVLDRGAGRVYKFLLDQSGQALQKIPNNILTRKGDKFAGTALGDLSDIIWMPSGPLRASASLLILDSQGTLLDYRPDKGIQPLPLRGAQGWTSFKGARGFSGNLYILDPAANQVWRYVPTSTGYDSEARGILDNADIADASDLAIDGNVYVLSSRGTVQEFAGDVKTFVQDGMDRPLGPSSAIFATPSTNYVYVADSSNGRIVAFDKNGKFRFQVLDDTLQGVQGLFVDEGQGRLYFTSGQKLFVTSISIPAPPKP